MLVAAWRRGGGSGAVGRGLREEPTVVSRLEVEVLMARVVFPTGDGQAAAGEDALLWDCVSGACGLCKEGRLRGSGRTCCRSGLGHYG